MSSRQRKWDLRFLRLAREIGTWSKDPGTKVGAVIVDPERHIVSTGYNGFPKGLDDDPRDYLDRDLKLNRILHAEMNSLLRAHRDLSGHTLYTYPLMSCVRCAVHVIQSGVSRCVSVELEGGAKERWGSSVEQSLNLFAAAGIQTATYKTTDLE
jgi:dCMP deaminase